MKKLLLISSFAVLTLSTANAQTVFQLPNSDFESDSIQAYKDDKFSFFEPQYWHGYATIDGTIGQMGRSGEKLNMSTDVRPDSKGKQSVVIKCTSIMGIKANGVMTTGRIYANSVTATDADQNYNYSEPGKKDDSHENANSSFSQPFQGHPDAMRVWVKFDAAEETQKSDYKYASCNAVITTGARYQDPEGTTDFSAVRVARAYDDKIAKYGEWQQLEMPFDYTFGENDDPQYILISFTTNAQPGAGTADDKLYIDDIEMVYNHGLSSIKVADKEIFEAGKTEFDCSDVVFDGFNLDWTKDGKGAKSEMDFNRKTGVATITVKAEDFEVSNNSTTYTVQFKTEESEERTYTEKLDIKVNDVPVDPIDAKIIVNEYKDGSCDLSLPNFSITLNGQPMPIGTINLTYLSLNSEGGVKKFSDKRDIKIVPGDDPSVPWTGPSLGNIPLQIDGKMNDTRLYCTLNIELAGIKVNVTVGEESAVPTKETKTYKEKITDGDTEYEGLTEFVLTDNEDGTVDMLIKDLSVNVMGVMLPVGDVNIPGIEAKKEDGVTNLYTKQTVHLPAMDIEIEINGRANDEHIYFVMSIPLYVKNIVVGSEENVPTGIENIFDEDKACEIFDVQGRKVSDAQSGNIYIFRQSNGNAKIRIMK